MRSRRDFGIVRDACEIYNEVAGDVEWDTVEGWVHEDYLAVVSGWDAGRAGKTGAQSRRDPDECPPHSHDATASGGLCCVGTAHLGCRGRC